MDAETKALRTEYSKLSIVPTLQLFPYILLRLLFEIILFPISTIAFSYRVFGKTGFLWLQKLAGGTNPTKSTDRILFVGHGFGEARKAIQAAKAVHAAGKHQVAVWVEYPEPYRLLKSDNGPIPVALGPLNNPFSASIALMRWKPKAVIFIQRPARPNIAIVLRLMKVRAMVANVNISSRRIAIKKRQILPGMPHVLTGLVGVQGKIHKERLIEIGVPACTTRIFGPPFPQLFSPDESTRIREKWVSTLGLGGFSGTAIVAGSTREGEEAIVLDAFQNLRLSDPDARLILAPRDLNRLPEIEQLINSRGIEFIRNSGHSAGEIIPSVLLLDSYGELAEVYSVATVAFVGGTFLERVGGHSFSEPVNWGVAVTIGPHFGTQEASFEVCNEAEILTICHDANELCNAWVHFVDKQQESKLKAESLIERQSHVYENWVEAIL